MGFAQLYYTSCETGLSGFAGFQFNAVTPGLPPEVLRSVEALTSYKPPPSIGARPTEAEIAACPVNLVYALEPATILARVVFVGTDFSHRSGNYFAHALVSEAGPDAFGKILPIELWGSGMWESTPVSDNDLPLMRRLPEPSPDGMVSRAAVGRFLGEGARGEQLVTLLTAAESAMLRGGRPIVIVDPDPGTAARWIAAISFLLPPALARTLSFATYHHHPGYIDVHMTGTTPDSDFDLNDTAFRSYVVLDSVTGRISQVEPAPAALLLARAGPGQAAALWRRAGDLADIPGATLADWHPALVMAALMDGPEVTEADLDVLSDWLRHRAGQLRPGEGAAALRAFLASPSRQPRHLAAFGALPGLASDHELAEQVEQAVAAEELHQLMTGNQDQASTGVPLTTAAGRQFAAHRCAGQLQGAPAKTALLLLGWSTEHGLTLPKAVLADCGERALGPQLILAPDEDTLGVVAGDPALAEGVLAHLAAVVAEQPDAVERAFAAGLADIVGASEVVLPAGLREAALLAGVRNHPEKRARALRQLTIADNQPGADSQQGQDNPLAERLLGRMWPAGRWTAAEALAVVQEFAPVPLPSGPILDWVAQAVLDPPRDAGYLQSYAAMCRLLREPEATGLLPAQARDRLDIFLGVADEIERAAGAERDGKTRARIIRNLAAAYPRQPPPAQDLLREALLAQPEQMTGSRYLPFAVENYPEPVVSAFLDTARQRVAAVPRDIAGAARLFRCLAALLAAGDSVLAPGLEPALGESLGKWRSRDLNGLHEQLRSMDPVVAEWFDSWRRHGTTGARRPWRRLRESRSKGKS